MATATNLVTYTLEGATLYMGATQSFQSVTLKPVEGLVTILGNSTFQYQTASGAAGVSTPSQPIDIAITDRLMIQSLDDYLECTIDATSGVVDLIMQQ